jgi:hypothetical protein
MKCVCDNPLSIWPNWQQAPKKSFVVLSSFVKPTSVQRGSHQIVRGGYGVNVSSQVKIELLHGDHLAVAAAGRATLDPERRPLAGLPNACKNALVKVRAKCLAQTHSRRGLSLAEWGGGDRGHQNVLAIRLILEAL